MFSKKKKDQDEILDTIDTDTIEDTSFEADDLDATAPPKKKLPAWVIIPIIAVLGVGVFAASKLSSGTDKAQGVSLNVTTVKTSDIKEIYNASGKIESENTKTYYSPVTAPITKCNIAVGDTVKAGDVIISFDTTNLERDNQKAQLSLQTSLNSTQASHAQNAKAINAANATASEAADQANQLADEVNNLACQVDEAWNIYQQNIVDAAPLVEKNEKEREKIRPEIEKLNVAMADAQKQMDDIIWQFQGLGENAALAQAKPEEERTEGEKALLKAYADYTKAQKTYEYSDKMIKELTAKLEAIIDPPVDDAGYADLQTQYDAAYAQWEAAYNVATSTPAPDAGMTAAEAANLEISDNMAELTALTPAELVAKGKEGMKADMNGVIASVDALQSNTATQGMAMFTVATTDKVRMKIEVSPDDYDKMKVGNEAAITGDDIAFLKTTFGDSVKSVSASTGLGGSISTRKGDFDTYVYLTTPDYENAQFTESIAAGKYFTDNDVANGNPVCVIDELTALYLFGNTDIIGMSIELQVDSNIQSLTISGIRETSKEMMEAEKQYLAMGMDKSIRLEIPYTLSNDLGSPVEAFAAVSITANDQGQASRIAKTAVQILTSRHQNLGDTPFIQQKPMDLADMFGSIMDGVTAFVALVAGISLIVGGIGVMNIMLVSVTERTREIGIRKALGAKTGSIIAQFLCESAIISGMGGIIGILLGAGLTALISALGIGGIKAQLSFPAILIATIFSCSVGIVFGIYPARKAARLSPIEALRRM